MKRLVNNEKNFLVLKDRLSGKELTIYEPANYNLIAKLELPDIRSEAEFSIIEHDLIQFGLNYYFPRETNSFCYIIAQGFNKPFIKINQLEKRFGECTPIDFSKYKYIAG